MKIRTSQGEIFNCISFINPLSLFKNQNRDIRLSWSKYWYIFPQRDSSWKCVSYLNTSYMFKNNTTYYWLGFRLKFFYIRTPNLKKV